jgi:murein DD-endopeptidase MepM/ murein hydrolase activator NlpD
LSRRSSLRREIPQKVDAQFNFAGWSRSTSAVRVGATLFRRTRSASVLSITLTATALGVTLPQQNAAAHLALMPNALATLSTANYERYLAPQRENVQPLPAVNGSELTLSSPIQPTVWQVQAVSDHQSPAFSTTPNVLTSLDISEAVVAPGSETASQAASGANIEDKVILNPNAALLKQTGALVHTVEKGENLSEIADKYRVSPDSIAQTNRIPNPNVIDVNEDLVIPASSTASATTGHVVTATQIGGGSLPTSAIALMPTQRSGSQSALSNAPNVSQVARRSIFPQIPPLELPQMVSAEHFLPSQNGGGMQRFIWPANGVFTSGYGWRWGRPHRGIDIAAPVGTPVVASASGIVITAGWNDGGFGNLVEIRHPDGTVTRYAHNQTISTRVGAVLNQGEMIAQMGSTGRSTGPHSHFEIHPGGRGAIDPMFLLSRRQ